MPGVIKEVALDPPDLVVHLLPLGARINVHLHFRKLQWAAFARFRRALGRFLGLGDEPLFSLLVEHLLAVRGKRKRGNTFEQFVGLAGLEGELLQSKGRRSVV